MRSIVWICFFSLLNAATRDIAINGLSGQRCTITVSDKCTGHDAISLVRNTLEIHPLQRLHLLAGTKHISKDEPLGDDVKALALVVEPRSNFIAVKFQGVFKRVYEVEIIPQSLVFLDPKPIEAMLIYYKTLREALDESPIIELSIKEFFDLLDDHLYGKDFPCRPKFWSDSGDYIPYCDYETLLYIIEYDVLNIFCSKKMTLIEQRLFALLVTSIGGNLNEDSANPLKEFRMSRIIDLRIPVSEKIDRNHPKMKEMLADFLSRTGDFTRDPEGNIRHVDPGITRFMDYAFN